MLSAAGFAAYQIVFHPATSELSGVPFIMLTLPWSLILTQAQRSLGLHPDGIFLWLNLAVGLLINAAAFYVAGRLIDPRRT